MDKESDPADLLREAAEARLAGAPVVPLVSTDTLLHELRVHQVELEMQNENLRQAHIEMEASRDRYANLYDFAPVAYLTVSGEGLVSEANLTCAELLGVERSKLLRSRFDRYVAPDTLDTWHQFFILAMQHDAKQASELRLRRVDGTTFYAQLDGASSGDAVRLSLTDNTERRQAARVLAEAQLISESEEKFHKISESAQDAIIMMGGDRCITFWNAAAARIFGYTAAEALGQETHALLAPGSVRPAFDRAYPHFHETGEGPVIGKMLELSAIRKGGEEFPVELSVSASQINGEWCAIAIVRDITERMRHQQLLAVQARIAGIFAMGGGDEEERFNEVLKVALDAMQSPFGVFGYIDTDGALVVPTMTRQVWDKCDMPEKSVRFPREAWGSSSWPRALREKRGNYSNQPSSAIPEGHIAISRHVCMPILYRGEVIGLLQVANKAEDYTEADVELLRFISADVAPLLDALLQQERASGRLRQQLLQLQNNLEDTVRAISAIVEVRDPYTAGHQLRVADIACAIAGKMGFSDEQIHGLHVAGVVHDLGKIQIPAEILSKPGRLSDTEYSLIKVHPQAGYDILKGIDFPWPVAEMVLQHHERMDGSGYPQGLKGDAILIEARILCVADVLEAMASHRPYRPGLGVEVALAEIVKGRATLYDKEVVDACVAVFREGYVLAG